MEVTTTKAGYDNKKRREPNEVFNFSEFELREDGSTNLGSWMEPTEKGLKQLAKLEDELGIRMDKKAQEKAEVQSRIAELEAENAELKAENAELLKESAPPAAPPVVKPVKK